MDDFKLAAPKTKQFVAVLKTLDLKKTVLVVTTAADQALVRAARNVADVEVTTSDIVNTYQVLRSDKLLFTKSAFELLDQRLQK